MIKGPFTSWPLFTEEESLAVQNVILSNQVNYWTGKECREFEKEFAAFSETKYAIALANGTTALDIAFKALDVGCGDEVIVTSRSYFASVSCIVNSGARPVFADVDLDTQNISINSIRAVLTDKTKAILCVHLAGWPCDMDPIKHLAAEYELFVIEDCAQAHGAIYKGRPVGSLGHIGTWSFCQDKIMTTGGEGGMVTTNDRKLWSKMWSYKDHGKSWEAIYEKEHPPGRRWVHDSFGTNWRMTEMQAVIGRIQLRRMPDWTSKRQANAEAIWNAARECALLRVPELSCEGGAGQCGNNSCCSHAAYKCYVFVKGDESLRNAMMEAINDRGVPCLSGSCSEVYLEHAFDHTDMRPKERLPFARELGETSLMFLCHPTLTKAEIQRTCDVIREVASSCE